MILWFLEHKVCRVGLDNYDTPLSEKSESLDIFVPEHVQIILYIALSQQKEAVVFMFKEPHYHSKCTTLLYPKS